MPHSARKFDRKWRPPVSSARGNGKYERGSREMNVLMEICRDQEGECDVDPADFDSR